MTMRRWQSRSACAPRPGNQLPASPRHRCAGDGAVSRRLVEPHRLVLVDRRWYVVAYDNERENWRTFRADRIEHAETTGVRVPPRELPAEDASAFVITQLHGLVPVFRAVATLTLPAEQAAARLGDHAGELEPLDDTSCRWRSPEDTVDHLRRLGDRVIRAVASGTSSATARRGDEAPRSGRSVNDLNGAL